MLKTIAALGLSAALALSPLAALAQAATDTTTPAAGAPAAGTEKPMKPKKATHHHMAKKPHKAKPMEAPAGGAAPAATPQ